MPRPDDDGGVLDIGVAFVGDELVVPPELEMLLADLQDDMQIEPPTAPQAPPPDPALLAELERRDRRLAELEGEARDLRENNLYLQAQIREIRQSASTLATDFDRHRQRARKEREDAERAGEERVLMHLLETADNLDRAFAHSAADSHPVFRGLQMVTEQVHARLRRLGVERVAATRGVDFDPEQHEAMQRVPTADLPAGSVVEEIAAGYRFRGRLLRPARVSVAMPSPTEPEAASPDAADPAANGSPPEPS